MHKLLSGKRVLVVEDEIMVLMNIEGALADLGCTTISAAATADDALALLESESFDVAMLDVNLDGQASDVVADDLARRSIPFLFLDRLWRTRDGGAIWRPPRASKAL